MRPILKRISPLFTWFLAPLLCIALTKLVLQPFQSYLDIQIIALIYLLPIMISTVVWGFIPGILAGFFGFLAFNYFYIPPHNTLLVHKTLDLITLFMFLVVAVVLSRFIGRAREGMRLARSREWEATRMYELISALSGLQEVEKTARELIHNTIETFHFDRVELFIPAREGEKEFVISTSSNSGGFSSPTQTLPLETARGVEGEMRIWSARPDLSPQEVRLLEAYTGQGALSLERARLARSENRARVLEESDRLKSSLLNSVSHDLRTPLAAIKASVSSLRSGAVDWNTDARQDLLVTIEEETDHLNLLVGNLLDMSRIESGALNPLKRWNAVDEIVVAVARKMRKQLVNHHLEINVSSDLPLVPFDFVMIGQVFTNLISNSIKYAPANTVISISAQVDQDCIHFEVANQGPQVPPEHLERIFEKFYRATEAEWITGTGLGLSICKGIVEAHGGRIWAENRGVQFVFHFALPLTLNGSVPTVPVEELDE